MPDKNIITKTIAYYEDRDTIEKNRDDTFTPITHTSINFKHWITTLDLRTCRYCRNQNGKIYRINEMVEHLCPIHERCRCKIEMMKSIDAGFATRNGEAGADFWLKYYGDLPDYYVTENEATALGWQNGKSPVKYVPGKMLTRGTYDNSDNHLPSAPGRIWYEAD